MTGLGGLPTWRAIWVGRRTTCIGVFSNNGYLEAIIQAGSEWSPGRREEEVRDEQGDKPLVVTIPYVSGLSEDIRRVCRRFNIKTAFKSGMTLRAHTALQGQG